MISTIIRHLSLMPASPKLSDLSAGDSAIIQAMPSGRSSLTRLREMGIVPGTAITFIRRAPLGEPIEISVRGSHLAMRDSEARHIEITSITPATIAKA
jgi:ferrous iron transport protein A